jgi:transposase
MEIAYDGRQVVGMDLHRRRSVLVRMTEDGRRLGTARITNSPAELRAQIARAGTSPKVVLEATNGWYWAADTLAAAGAEVHLAHPLGVKAFACRRVKNDERDAADLADLLRMGRLPEAWIAPPGVRELREITRCRQKLVHLRTSCKDQVHGVLAKLGVPVTCTGIFGTAGSAWPGGLGLPQPYAGKVMSLRQLTGELTTEITMLSEVISELLAADRGYQVIQQLPGIGPVLAGVIIAEIGEVTRFKNAGQLCSRAGLTPRHRESDIKVRRGHVTRQGSRMLRWALIEAIQRVRADTVTGGVKAAIIARRGKEARNIAKVAAARRLLTLVFYGMRDGQIRCLSQAPPPASRAAGVNGFPWPAARREVAGLSAPPPSPGSAGVQLTGPA